MSQKTGTLKRGFTLIELLIVIAIIAILALIAIPNFLEAQTRAKISRVKADMRSIATAMEAYYVDYNSYFCYKVTVGLDQGQTLSNLTTPVMYISTLGGDPFGDRSFKTERRGDMLEVGMGKVNEYSVGSKYPAMYDTWEIESAGPDKKDDTNDTENGALNLLSGQFPWLALDNTDATAGTVLGLIYDPTNGTISRGQIFRAGGACPGNKKAHQLWYSCVTSK
ncbi:MAG: prepilin-type N-terminal cleavage/methylation domain-containing protein [Candidatus Sumerlaeota bacterium]|nr:prepilin-type N-terminal cleavage/methylation domain-containing protein [Candidatus Sumerlaeota bacterium]